MSQVDEVDGIRGVNAWGGGPFDLDTYFTTDGSSAETIGTGADYGGRVTVSRPDESGAPNTYLVDFGKTWVDTQRCHVTHQLSATVNYVLTIDPTAGTVEIAFSGPIVSNRIDLSLKVSTSKSR
jgi:hypothetical protein